MAAGAVGATAQATMDKLVAKEREVAAKMQNLKERQQQVVHALQSLQPNWPGKFLCVRPIVYHHIPKAVPTDRQAYAKASYTCYFLTIVLILFNLVCCIAGFASEKKDGEDPDTDYGSQFGVSLIHLLGIPGAFLVWHFQVYQAIQTRGQLSRYGTAYLGLVVAFFYDVFMAIGLVGYGGAGFIFALKLKADKQSQGPFYMALICAIFWALQAAYFVFSFFKLRTYHNQDKAAGAPAGAVSL